MADTTTPTPEEISAKEVAAAQSRFLDSLGLSIGDATAALGSGDVVRAGQITADLATIASQASANKTDKLREVIGTKSPAELLTAFEAVDPTSKPFLDSLRANPALAGSIHNAVVNDPSVLEGMKSMGGEGGLDTTQLQAMIAEGSLNPTLAALFNKIAESPTDNIKFDTITGLMVKLDEEGLDAVNADLKGMGISEIKITGSLAATLLSPDELLTMIGKEAGIEIPEAALKDEAFKTALHDAIKKDPSVLEGMMNLKDPSGAGIEGFNPTDLQAMLADDRKRGIFTNVLDVVANNPDPKFNFKYMTDFAREIEEGDMTKIGARFREMGLDMPAPTGEDLMQLLGQYLNDPVGSASMFATMMNIDPNSAQGQAITNIMETMGQFIEMIIGGDTGYRAVFNHYMPGLIRDGGNFLNDISGETDKQNAIQAGSEKLAEKLRNINYTNEDLDTMALNSHLPTGSQIVIPSLAALEGDKSNVTHDGPRLVNTFGNAHDNVTPAPEPEGVDLRSDLAKVQDIENARRSIVFGLQ